MSMAETPTSGEEREKLEREATEQIFRRWGVELETLGGQLLVRPEDLARVSQVIRPKDGKIGADGQVKLNIKIGNREHDKLFPPEQLDLSEPALRAARQKLQQQDFMIPVACGLFTATLPSTGTNWYADQRFYEEIQEEIRAGRAQGEKMRRARPAVLPAHDIWLPPYGEMCRALVCCVIADCDRVDQVKVWRDQSAAVQAHAKRAKHREAEVHFAEIRVRAVRRIGELLDLMAERGERKVQGDATVQRERSSLSDLGLSEGQSHRYRQVAAVPPENFEAALRHARETQTPVTSKQIPALTRQPSPTPKQRDGMPLKERSRRPVTR